MEHNSCATCKYECNPIPAEPCFSCIHGLCDENPNRTEKWEAKDCSNCKYFKNDFRKEPCLGCNKYSCWEVKDQI